MKMQTKTRLDGAGLWSALALEGEDGDFWHPRPHWEKAAGANGAGSLVSEGPAKRWEIINTHSRGNSREQRNNYSRR